MKRAVIATLAGLLAVFLAGCGGSAIKRDARRLERRCGVVQGTEVNEEQARCIAKIFGIRHTERCPVEVDRPDGFAEPVYRVFESCNGLGAVVARSSGRVLAIVSGDEILYH